MAYRLVTFGLLSLVMACGGSEPNRDDIASDPDDGNADAAACPNDSFESNEVPEKATLVSWDQIAGPEAAPYQNADMVIDGFLCSGEHDWYRIPIEQLKFAYNVVRVDALVMGSSWCAHFDSCGGERLSSAPEHTLAVEVYDAASMVLLGADIASDGRVDVDGWGPNFSRDLLIYVSSPSHVATYPYELHVDVRSYDGEDECEC